MLIIRSKSAVKDSVTRKDLKPRMRFEGRVSVLGTTQFLQLHIPGSKSRLSSFLCEPQALTQAVGF